MGLMAECVKMCERLIKWEIRFNIRDFEKGLSKANFDAHSKYGSSDIKICNEE